MKRQTLKIWSKTFDGFGDVIIAKPSKVYLGYLQVKVRVPLGGLTAQGCVASGEAGPHPILRTTITYHVYSVSGIPEGEVSIRSEVPRPASNAVVISLSPSI